MAKTTTIRTDKYGSITAYFGKKLGGFACAYQNVDGSWTCEAYGTKNGKQFPKRVHNEKCSNHDSEAEATRAAHYKLVGMMPTKLVDGDCTVTTFLTGQELWALEHFTNRLDAVVYAIKMSFDVRIGRVEIKSVNGLISDGPELTIFSPECNLTHCQ